MGAVFGRAENGAAGGEAAGEAPVLADEWGVGQAEHHRVRADSQRPRPLGPAVMRRSFIVR